MACSHSRILASICWGSLLLLAAAYCQSTPPHEALSESDSSRQRTFTSLVQPNLRGLVDRFIRSVSDSQFSSQTQTGQTDLAAPAVAPAPTGGPSQPKAIQSESPTGATTAGEWVPAVAVDQLAQPPGTAPAPGASQASKPSRPGLLSHFQEVARWAGLDAVFASEILQGSDDLSSDQLQQHAEQQQLPDQLPEAHREGLTWVHGGQSNPDDEDVHPDTSALDSLEGLAAARPFPDELEETESLGSLQQEDVRFWPLISEDTINQPAQSGDMASQGDRDERPLDSEEPRLWPFDFSPDPAESEAAPWQLEATPLTEERDISEQLVGAINPWQLQQDAKESRLAELQSLRTAASSSSSSSSSSSRSAPGQFDPRLIATRGQGREHQQDAHWRPQRTSVEFMEDADVGAGAERQNDSWPWLSETAAIPQQQQPRDDSGSWDWIGKDGEDAVDVETELPGRAQALLTRALARLSRPFKQAPAPHPPAGLSFESMRPSLQEVAAEQSGELFMAPDDKAGYVSTTAAEDLLADLHNEMLREVLLERLRVRQLQHQVGERLARQARVEADAGPAGWTWPMLPGREASLSDCMDLLLGTRRPAVKAFAVQLVQPARRLLARSTSSAGDHKQGLDRQAGGSSSGAGSKSSEHGASSGSRSGETSLGIAARSVQQAEGGRLQSELYAHTKQGGKSASQQATPKATASSKAGVQQDSYEIFPGSKIVQETPMIEEETAGGKMRASGVSAAESNVQGSSKFASKPKGLVHGGKHGSGSKPLTLSSTSGSLEKPTAAQEEASNEGSDWISATLPVRKDEARTYQSELNDKAEK